jgi:flagellar motor protein MotB
MLKKSPLKGLQTTSDENRAKNRRVELKRASWK